MYWILGWLACGVVAYLLLKWQWSKEDLDWTCTYRCVMLSISVLGPLAVLVALMIVLVELNEDKRAK